MYRLGCGWSQRRSATAWLKSSYWSSCPNSDAVEQTRKRLRVRLTLGGALPALSEPSIPCLSTVICALAFGSRSRRLELFQWPKNIVLSFQDQLLPDLC